MSRTFFSERKHNGNTFTILIDTLDNVNVWSNGSYLYVRRKRRFRPFSKEIHYQFFKRQEDALKFANDVLSDYKVHPLFNQIK
jgi:hypothetical protein